MELLSKDPRVLIVYLMFYVKVHVPIRIKFILIDKMNDLEVIGAGVVGGGFLFFILGIFSFSSEFLITANLLFLIGLNMLMGPKSFLSFLIKKDKLKGTIVFLVGIILIFCKQALFGIISEAIGAYWLFGGFLPMLFTLLSKIPILGLIIPSSLKSKGENLD